MFRAVADDFGLRINKRHDSPIEVMMDIPKQNGLGFTITLGLQNGDELNIGVEGFWSYFFPYCDCRDFFHEVLQGLIRGDAYLLYSKQFGRLVKTELIGDVGNGVECLYSEYSRVRIPLLPYREEVLCNRTFRGHQA